ncbi:MAG: hypothetical protein PHV32_10315 [Eubacteriales bacterium]|nr:hypothetical protein [Eubacteriales bacterium]
MSESKAKIGGILMYEDCIYKFNGKVIRIERMHEIDYFKTDKYDFISADLPQQITDGINLFYQNPSYCKNDITVQTVTDICRSKEENAKFLFCTIQASRRFEAVLIATTRSACKIWLNNTIIAGGNAWFNDVYRVVLNKGDNILIAEYPFLIEHGYLKIRISAYAYEQKNALYTLYHKNLSFPLGKASILYNDKIFFDRKPFEYLLIPNDRETIDLKNPVDRVLLQRIPRAVSEYEKQLTPITFLKKYSVDTQNQEYGNADLLNNYLYKFGYTLKNGDRQFVLAENY